MMSQYYEDIDQLYEIYGHFMEKILTDPKIGPKMSKAGIVIKFIYTNPDGEITIDLKNPPTKPGYYGSYQRGRLVQAGGGLLSFFLARAREPDSRGIARQGATGRQGDRDAQAASGRTPGIRHLSGRAGGDGLRRQGDREEVELPQVSAHSSRPSETGTGRAPAGR
jgi:hypothetical protein